MKTLIYTIDELYKAEGKGGYGQARVPLTGLGMPGSGQFRQIKLGKEEKKRMAKRRKIQEHNERVSDIKTYGVALNEKKL